MNIEIYTKDNCSFCDDAKIFMRNASISFTEYKLNGDFTKEILKDKFPLASTYPVIVIGNFFIGGYKELKDHVAEIKDSRKFLIG